MAFWDFGISDLISAGANIGSAYIASNQAQKGQEQANQANISAAREMMAHQINMYKHRHQWEVDDLRAAGLNPVLSAIGGQPPIGAGAMPQIHSTKKDAVQFGIQAASAMTDIMKRKLESKLLQQETRKSKAQADVAEQERDIQTSPVGKGFNWVKYAMNSGLGGILGGIAGMTTARSIRNSILSTVRGGTGSYGRYFYGR